MPEKINVRGVLFDNVSLEEAVDILRQSIAEGRQTALFTPNSEIVQNCIENDGFRDVINSGDLIIPDGIGVVKAARILGTPFSSGKVAGIETGEGLIKSLAGSGTGIYFLGGKPGVAELAAEKLKEKYGDLNFVGLHDGYFDKKGEENTKVIDSINDSGAEVLFVCLGSPAQENWICENRSELGNVKAMLALGGSLDGYAGTVKRAPKVFIKLGLEWFYRLVNDPKRIGRMMKLPKFYLGTLKYKITHKNKPADGD